MDPAESQVPEAAASAPPEYVYPKGYDGLENLAINAYGWAMPIPEDIDKKRPTFLTAVEPTTKPNTPWELASKVMEGRGVQPWRNSFSLTPEERSEFLPDASFSRYVLVGFTLTNLRPEHLRAPSTPPCPRSLTTSTNLFGPWICQPTIVDNHVSKAIYMVVARMERKRPAKISLYALLGPTHGVCTRYRASRHECFYLPIFRVLCGEYGSPDIRMCVFNERVATAATLPPPQAPVLAQPAFLVDEAAEDSKAEIQPSTIPLNSFYQGQEQGYPWPGGQ